ncbi:ribosome hibernation-promoting factor, HPF/YfiA family [Phycisphaerales bacterium AB-hyl4]|uniref:Ribosome hibernation promoting factor n=1 Tax=Natronomicrosphaera hydrolytica TaxID=3242702 RepID=A0ABV4U439_9BACT
MEIIVSGKHIEITDPIRDYAIEKAGKMPRYFDRVQAIDVVADKRENHQYEVEMIVHVEHHEAFVAKSKGEDLYGCIDETADKMERQLTDHKEKIQDRKRQPSR